MSSSSRPASGRGAAAVVSVLAILLPLLLALPAAAWSSSGPITRMTTSLQLSCSQIAHEDSDAPDGPSPNSRVGDCGTMVWVDGSNLYAADRLSPGGSVDQVQTWRNISGDGFGDGSAADPVRSVTRVGGSQQDDPDLEVEETNAYIAGEDAYLNTVEIFNHGPAPLRGILYRRADCTEVVFDPATSGAVLSYETSTLTAGSGGSIACTFTHPDLPGGAQAPRVVMTPHTPGSSYLGDDFGDENLFQPLEGGRQVYGNSCVCDQPIDAIPRIGLSWAYEVAPGASVTFQHSFAFAPLGGDINPVSSLAGDTGPPPGADNVTRLSGPSRFETAVAISQELFPGDGSASAVALARADNFADALAGGPFAKAQNASLLLTSTDSLHPATQAELQRVLPAGGTVFVLGGTAAVSDAVVGQVEALGYTVQRISGPTRYATATEIARNTTGNAREVWFADGNTFGNALAAGAAAAGRSDAVLLLLNGAEPTADIDAYLAEGDNTAAQQYLLGPLQESSDLIAVQANRTWDEGSPIANAAALASDPIEGFDPSAVSAVALASAEAFPDGLAGGVLAGRLGIPLLLTGQGSLAGEAAAAMDALAPLAEAYLFGGEAALSADVAAAAASRLS